MPKGFLPTSDSALLGWSQHFATQINSDPLQYGISPAQAAEFTTLQANYATAMEACDPNVRNKVSVVVKNTARQALKDSARLLARLVYGTAGVTDAQKITLGLSVRTNPSPNPAPQDSPGIRIESVRGNALSVQLSDKLVARIGKPPGVDGACYFSFVGMAAPASLSEWTFEGITSRTKVEVVFPASVAPGSRVWITAQWFNTRKQTGPLAAPVSTNVAGATVRLAA